jgi:hypothetical protein
MVGHGDVAARIAGAEPEITTVDGQRVASAA